MSKQCPNLGQFLAPVQSANPAYIFGGDEFSYIDITAIDRENRAISNPQVFTGSDAPSRARQLIKAGDILVSTVRPNLNTVAVVGRDFDGAIASTGFCVLRVEGGRLDGGYLFHWITSERVVRHLSALATGASYPAVSDKIIKSLPIVLPAPEEQKRIAAILDKADSLLRKRQQAIRLADDFLRAVFLDMFGDLQINSKCWDSLYFGDLIKEGPTNGLYCPADMYGSGTPILRIDGFYDGRLLSGYKFKRVRIEGKTIGRYRLQNDSIVINRVNSREFVGKAAYIDELRETTVFESNMMNMKLDNTQADPVFIVEQMRMPFIRSQIATARKDAVNQSSVNQEDIRNLKIRLPPLHLQKRFRAVYQKYVAIDELFADAAASADAVLCAISHQFFG